MRYRLCTGLMEGGMCRYMWGINKDIGVEEEYLIVYPGGNVLREMCTLRWN